MLCPHLPPTTSPSPETLPTRFRRALTFSLCPKKPSLPPKLFHHPHPALPPCQPASPPTATSPGTQLMEETTAPGSHTQWPTPQPYCQISPHLSTGASTLVFTHALPLASGPRSPRLPLSHPCPTPHITSCSFSGLHGSRVLLPGPPPPPRGAGSLT